MKFGITVLFALTSLSAFAGQSPGRAVIPDGSGRCPGAVSAWISESQTLGLIDQIESFGTDEGNNFTQADIPQLEKQVAALTTAARTAEKACGVGDQSSEAQHVIACAEGNADIQLDPDGILGGSMEACPPGTPINR